MGIGTWGQENCGPASAVIALVAVGNAPAHRVSGAAGAAPGGNSTVVKDTRAHCGLPVPGPALGHGRRPLGHLRVDYQGASLAGLELGISEYGGSTNRVGYGAGVGPAADKSAVILHVRPGMCVTVP